jgi:hypothetical protein
MADELFVPIYLILKKIYKTSLISWDLKKYNSITIAGAKLVVIGWQIIFIHWQINKTMIKGLMFKFLRRLLC